MKRRICALLAVLLLAYPCMGLGEMTEERLNVRYVCTEISVFGQPKPVSMLPGEHALLFLPDGSCRISLGSEPMCVTYHVRADGVYVVNCYGVRYECVPTETGFEMDYHGVLLHYEPEN